MSTFGMDPTSRRGRGRVIAGVWRGKVTRVAPGAVYVQIPRFARSKEFGPIEALETATPLAAEDRVLCAFIEGNPDLPVVLGRLP